MRTSHAYARLGIAPDLRLRLAGAAVRVAESLRSAKIAELGLSSYAVRYLRDHLAILPFSMQSTVAILGWAIGGHDIRTSDGCLVDYGGGIGLISLVAAAAGVPVTYADLREGSARDARLLAEAIGLPAKVYLVGDLPQIIAGLRANGLRPLAFTSYDVVEHIYDVPAHISALTAADLAPQRVVYASSANARNPRIRRKLTALHQQAETVGSEDEAAYVLQRRTQIDAMLPGLPEAGRLALAVCTRGLAGDDLAAAIDAVGRGDVPPTPRHPSNTCDPRTGNWCEQLLDQDELVARFNDAGWHCVIRPGYYGESGGLVTQLAKHGLNAAISVLGTGGLALAPYFAVIADRPTADGRP